MAKIQDLVVDTIKIANNSVHGVVSSTTAIVVPNALAFPVLITSVVGCQWSHGSGSDQSTFTVTVVRTRGSVTVVSRVVSRSGGNGTFVLSDGAYDIDPSTSDTYTLTANVSTFNSSGGATASITSRLLSGLYTKR